jgi:hypothetical protein
LFIDTYRGGGEFCEEIEKLKRSFRNKALILHVVTTMSRVLYPLLGISFWQKAFKNRESHQDVNWDFIDEWETYIKATLVGFIILGVLLDIVCWRRRELSSLILYYELVQYIVYGFVPLNHGDAKTFVVLMVTVYTYVAYGVGLGPHLLCTVLT